MSQVFQLRIVDPHEQFTVHDLDVTKGIVTIGKQDTDDVLLESPGSAFYHLEIDYREPPYRLTIPAEARALTINGEFVPPGGSYDILDRDVIRVTGYTITFRAYDDEIEVVPPPRPEPEPELPPPLEELPPAVPEEETSPPEEESGPSIVSSLPEEAQAWTLDVTQAAVLPLTVVNAGPLVAQFNVVVEGVPAEWVDVEPDEFHLNERADKIVTITITPPRLPTSRARTHSVRLVVTSADHYPGAFSTVTASITILPYYEIAVGNPSPRLLSIPWSQPSAQIEIPLANKGNSEAWVGLSAEDDARACRFEFQVPDDTGEPLRLARQVNLRVPFDQTLMLPVRLIPVHRPLIGSGGRLFDLRPRVHPYTVTATMSQGQGGPWTLAGEWENAPRFSRWVLSVSILALVLLLLAGIYWVYKPSLAALDDVYPASIRAGQIVQWNWKDTPRYRIGFRLDGKPVTPPFYARPDRTTTYEVRADTWLSRLLPALSDTRPDTVAVRPVKPDILLFEARPQRITPGGRVVLSWLVADARELVLVDHGAGVQETLAAPCGSREVQVGDDSAHYTLRAIAAGGDVVERVVTIDVGSPMISVFAAKPAVVAAGTPVTLIWSVLGTGAGDQIALSEKSQDGVRLVLTSTPPPARGTVTHEIAGTTLFTLSVSSGSTPVVETIRVNVLKPTPVAPVTPTPAATPRAPSSPTTAPTPGTIVVYTALSEDEVEQLHFGGAQPIKPAGLPGGLPDVHLTAEELAEFDYVVPAPNALSAHILIVRKSTHDLIRQLLAERDAPRADVIWMVAATGMIRLRAEGMLEPLAGVYEPDGLQHIQAGWSDPTNPPEWVGLTAWVPAFCVNEGQLSQQERDLLESKSWAALIDPRFRDRAVVMPDPYKSGTGYMVVSGLIQMQPYGEPDGWAYMDRLHESIDWYAHSGADPCDQVKRGQSAIGIGANICSSDPPISPFAVIYPEPGAGWEMDAVALARKETISKGALAFLTWAIGEQAMNEYAGFRSILSYEGLERSQACAAGPENAGIDPEHYLWASANFERIVQEWQSRYNSTPE